MGQVYRGEHQAAMLEQLQRAREHIERSISEHFPNHVNWFHLIHRGISYHFYMHNVENLPVPARLDYEVSVRIVRDELFESEIEDHTPSTTFRIPNGDLAARVQEFNINFELENMPSVVRIYKHWLHHGFEHPQFANVLVILE